MPSLSIYIVSKTFQESLAWSAFTCPKIASFILTIFRSRLKRLTNIYHFKIICIDFPASISITQFLMISVDIYFYPVKIRVKCRISEFVWCTILWKAITDIIPAFIIIKISGSSYEFCKSAGPYPTSYPNFENTNFLIRVSVWFMIITFHSQ